MSSSFKENSVCNFYSMVAPNFHEPEICAGTKKIARGLTSSGPSGPPPFKSNTSLMQKAREAEGTKLMDLDAQTVVRLLAR